MSNIFFFWIFFWGLFSMIVIRKHVFLCLIMLEFIVVSLLYLIVVFCLMYSYNFYLYVFMMTFYVCEGVLGLSLMVSMIRTHGNDYLNSFGFY